VTWLLAIISGAIAGISFLPGKFSWLCWFSLVPLGIAIVKTDKRYPFRSSFLLGLVSGFVFYSITCYWVWPTITVAGGGVVLAFSGAFLLAGYLALYWGLAALFWKYSHRLNSFFGCFAIAAVWVLADYIRTYLFSGFPWASLGYSQWKDLALVQIAEWTGVYGVTFLIVLFNSAIVQFIALRRPSLAKGARVGLVAGITVLVLCGIGLFRYFQISRESTGVDSVSVAVLQGNIDPYVKWDTEGLRSSIRVYSELLEKTASKRPEPDVVVWPESAIPALLADESGLMHWALPLVQQVDASHLIGALTQASPEKHGYFNSLYLLKPDGEIGGVYHKVHLVPYGEYIPMERFLRSFIPLLREVGGFKSGRDIKTLKDTKATFGPLICYETLFPGLSRNLVRKGANVLVNITQEGWYRSLAFAYQSLGVAVFRAVETRRPLVRAGNTGISAFIDQSGNVSKTLPLGVSGVLIDRVIPCSFLTFYVKYGDIFVIICAVILTAVIIYGRRKYGSGLFQRDKI
jgi:apolipoprotein N-acyltransferase